MKLVHWRGLVAAGVVVTMAGVLAGPAVQAGAATPWAITTTPNPVGSVGSQLSDVSCTSATACMAVGSYVKSGAVHDTLAERWNGTAWAIKPTPKPVGSTQSGLSAVACTSATACTAVGYASTSSGAQRILAEKWNGTAWAIQTTPSLAGATYISVRGLSCTSATACTVVGDYGNASNVDVTLAEQWNGTAWAIQTTQNPVGAVYSQLMGVSCTSATACTAVGEYENASNVQVTLAERWDGTSWAIQTTQNPVGATNLLLDSVSCTSATACMAVGEDRGASSGGGTLAEQWNGTAWAIYTTRGWPGSVGSGLGQVSCTSATDCTAVGGYEKSTLVPYPMAEHWNGVAWGLQSILTPSHSGTALPGVSCTSATACMAVGDEYNAKGTDVTLAERYT